MSDTEQRNDDGSDDDAGGERPFKRVRNLAEPLKLTGVNMCGVSAEAVNNGGTVEIITRAALLSTQSFFHRVAPNLMSSLEYLARQDGHSLALSRASSILLVIRPDDTADLWIDSAAVMMDARLKRSVEGFTVIMQDDIVDITGLWFPDVEISPECRMVYLFREGFRFALAFDLRTDEPLDLPGMRRTLARLHRQMKYADVYSMLASQDIMGSMIGAGWFPFIEIMTSEFTSLSGLIESGLPLDDAEGKLVEKFTSARLGEMFERWMAKSHFAEKRVILREAVDSFIAERWISCLKISLTEIEGLVAESYREATGKSTRDTQKLMDYAVDTAVQIAGGDDTLFFPVGFGRYLKEYTFADSSKRSASRHAIGHGRAKSSDYTQARALQALLTLDQIAYFS